MLKYIGISFLPRKLVSFLFGRVARLELPKFILKPFLDWFIDRYGVNMEESALSLESFSTVLEFFTRELKDTARPIGKGVVSPADGNITEFGEIESETLIGVKGSDYTLADFLLSEEERAAFVGGAFVVVYLAPGDYHRVHAPVAGSVVSTSYFSGSLWPVNSWSTERVSCVFARNERVTVTLKTDLGLMGVVCVGALNVGSIKLAMTEFRTNQHPLSLAKRRIYQEYSNRLALKKGAQLATFELGSTVVILLPPSARGWVSKLSSRRVRMGETLG